MDLQSCRALFADHRIRAIWDRSREALTLGGLLILRQEMEQLARLCEANEIKFFLSGAEDAGRQAGDIHLVRSILKSKYPITIETQETPAGPVWPPGDETRQPFFSYQSFGRVTRLARLTGESPVLGWDASTWKEATSLRKFFSGRLYLLHLKKVGDGKHADSNANLNSWGRFFKEQAIDPDRAFLILGDEEIPEDILKLPGVHKASVMKISLATQLCLVALSDGFLGMASGICQAAILSRVPYVVFKHPQHHVEEMKRELGASDAFPFAGSRQKIWRLEDRTANISRAFNLVAGNA